MTTRRFELVGEKSKKFWEVTIDGSTVRTRWGRIGTAGRTTDTKAADATQAAALAAKMVGDKTRKGYGEVASEVAPSRAAPDAPAREPEVAKPALTAAVPPAPEPTPEKGARKKARPKATILPKKVKAPKRSSHEYVAVATRWRSLLEGLGAETVDPDSARDELLALLENPFAIAVLDAEHALANLSGASWPHSISTDADVQKLWANDPPEELAAAYERNELARRQHAARLEARYRMLVLLLERGADPFKIPRRDYDTPLERFVRTLPWMHEEDKLAHPWNGSSGTSVLDVIEAFAAAGDAGLTAPPGRPEGRGCSVFEDAALRRCPLFDAILAKGPDVPSSLLGWSRIVSVHPPHDTSWEEARLAPLAQHLTRLGASGLSREGRPGALIVAIRWGNLAAIEALASAGTDLDARAPMAVTAPVTVPTKLLPATLHGDPQQQTLRVEEGFTSRDAVEALLELYDDWEAVIGEREGTTFATFGHSRRNDHERVRSVAAALAARGVATSGKRVAGTGIVAEHLPVEVKEHIDRALIGVIHRLGGDEAQASTLLAGMDGGRLDLLAYLRMTTQAMQPLVPVSHRFASLGTAWLGEWLGYSDSLASVDPDELSDFTSEARKVLRKGEWLGTRGDEVAVLDPGGRVLVASVRYGVDELAPDLLTFVTRDLETIRPVS